MSIESMGSKEKRESPLLKFSRLYNQLSALRNMSYGILPTDFNLLGITLESAVYLQTEQGVAELSRWREAFSSTFAYLDEGVVSATEGEVGFNHTDWNQGIIALQKAIEALQSRLNAVNA